MIARRLIPDDHRCDHIADLFVLHFPLRLEPTIFAFADRLSEDYTGGYWNFYALSNGGFFMAPESDALFTVYADNGFQGKMSAEAFGITACLYAYSNLSFGDGELAEECAKQFHLLREYMLDHPEAGAILSAID